MIKSNYNCSLMLIHDLIGGKWKLRILWHILNGDNRFSLLQKSITDITHKVLISQLKEMEQNGILVKTDFNEKTPRIEYSLSHKYRHLIVILNELDIFARQYAVENTIHIPHTSCVLEE